MTETDKKTADDGYVLSADWSDKPSEAVHVEMSVKEVGELQSSYPVEGVSEIAELSPDCAGPVGGPVSGAFEINRIFYEGPPELLAELERVMEAKEERDELVHEMLKVADEWGRQKASHIKGAANNKIRTFISMENDLIQEARHKCKENKKLSKANAKKGMKMVQESLNSHLKTWDSVLESETDAIRTQYRAMYSNAEEETKQCIDEVLARVTEFSEAIQGLTLEQLQELKESGVRISSSDIAVSEEDEDVRHQESD